MYGFSWDAERLIRRVDSVSRPYRPSGGFPIWLTENGSANGGGSPTDAEQAAQLTGTYRRMNSLRYPNWTKTFQHHLWHPPYDLGRSDDGLRLIDYALTAPRLRPALDCLRQVAFGIPLSTICTQSTECDAGLFNAYAECKLNAVIAGHMVVRPNTSCGWQGYVNGISPGFSYTWRKNNIVVGTGSQYQFTNNGTGFTMSLTAVDAAGRSAVASRSITVNSTAQSCSN